MTPVTPVSAINDPNNNNTIKEELAWSQIDNDEDDHFLTCYHHHYQTQVQGCLRP